MHVVRVLGKLEPGGAQLAVLRLSRELARHGVTTTLLAGDATHDGLRLAERYGVATLAMRSRARVHPTRNRQWEQSHRFADWIADKLADGDVVHAHMVGAWWASAQVIAPQTPLVVTEHNEVNWSARRVAKLRTAASRIDRFFAMGPAARRFALQAGVRADILRAARSPIEGLRGTAAPGLRHPRLTFAGRLDTDKGPDVLVAAIARLGRPELTCYLLGDGPLRAELAARIDRAGLADRVLLPGWIDKPWTYLAGSSVHVVPSREEAWSQSAVLALGLGVPVVGTAVDGLADTLSHSRGLTVEPDDPAALADAINDVLEGAASLDRAGALQYARQFTAPRVAEFYAAEYRALRRERSAEMAGGMHRDDQGRGAAHDRADGQAAHLQDPLAAASQSPLAAAATS